jgi:hypothetical protein
MNRSATALAGLTGTTTAATIANRLGTLDVRTLASSPQAFADGRVWLLLTSAILADRPAAASILGFFVVGLAALAICGSRILWLSALLGHVGSAVVVYLGIGLIRDVAHGAYQGAVAYPDYGTSAIIAAWIGAIAFVAWRNGLRRSAVAFVLVAAAVGWLCKSDLTILDTEHAFAFAFGAATARLAPLLQLPGPRRRPAPSPTS